MRFLNVLLKYHNWQHCKVDGVVSVTFRAARIFPLLGWVSLTLGVAPTAESRWSPSPPILEQIRPVFFRPFVPCLQKIAVSSTFWSYAHAFFSPYMLLVLTPFFRQYVPLFSEWNDGVVIKSPDRGAPFTHQFYRSPVSEPLEIRGALLLKKEKRIMFFVRLNP